MFLPIMFSKVELELAIEALQDYHVNSGADWDNKNRALSLAERLAEIHKVREEQTAVPTEPAKKVIGACAVQVERNTKVLEMLLEKLSFFDVGFARDEMKDILTGDSVSDTEKEEG